MSIFDTDICVLCRTESESLTHLFFGCYVIKLIWNKVISWLSGCFCNTYVPSFEKVQRSSKTKFQKAFYYAVIDVLTYLNSRAMNCLLWSNVAVDCNVLYTQIMETVIGRIKVGFTFYVA